MVLVITQARRRILSGLFVNLAAAWFAAAALTPNLVSISKLADFLVLTYDVLGGIIFMILATVVEEKF